MTPAGGPAYAVHRIASGTDELRARQRAGRAHPAGSEIRGTLVRRLQRPVGGGRGAGGRHRIQGTPTAVLTLTDGDVITLQGAVGGDKHWLEVEPGKDAALAARTQGRAFEVAGYGTTPSSGPSNN